MDRIQLLVLGLPLFLFCSDLLNIFTPPPPPKPSHTHQHHHHHQHQIVPPVQKPLNMPTQTITGGGDLVRLGRGTAMTIKKMLETSFPGINVVLANYPPALPKRLLSKMVPVFQIGVFGIVMAGEHIFPMLGFVTPPPWYFTMRQNRFGTIATAWLLGNTVQSFLQSSGAFEVYCNDELIFSKLKEQRFPSEFELREIVSKRLTNSRIVSGFGAGGIWSS